MQSHPSNQHLVEVHSQVIQIAQLKKRIEGREEENYVLKSQEKGGKFKGGCAGKLLVGSLQK